MILSMHCEKANGRCKYGISWKDKVTLRLAAGLTISPTGEIPWAESWRMAKI